MTIHAILDRLFSKKEIVNCERQVYLHRWYIIRTKLFAVFFHKFVSSDEDRALHDHPWNFIVIPIWRGYIEHSFAVCPECEGSKPWHEGHMHFPGECKTCGGAGRIEVKRRVYPIIGARYRPATYCHRVELLEWPVSEHTRAIIPGFNPAKPAWSLFIRFREWRQWGFHLPVGWQQWNLFWQDKCE